jgi:hypothetical protein
MSPSGLAASLAALLISLSVSDARAQGDAPVPPELSWRYDKGLVAATADGQFELKLGIRSQTRFEVNHREGAGELENRFYLPRTRLQLEGFAFGDANAYKIEYDLSNKGFSVLKDFYLERRLAGAAYLRLGQYKKPFNRQELTSDFAQAFNERSPIGEVAGSGRDLGLMAHSGVERSKDGVEWAIGVFNGTSEKSTQGLSCADPGDPEGCKVSLPSNVPADLQPEVVARLGFNHGGIKGYSELDLEGGPLRFAVAAAYRARLGDLVGVEAIEHAVGLDAMIKVSGFDLTGGAFLIKEGEAEADLGGYGQAGLVVVPERVALSARFGVAPIEGTTRNRLEFLGGVNLLAHGHGMKLVLDGGVIHDTATKADDAVARAQAQLVF